MDSCVWLEDNDLYVRSIVMSVEVFVKILLVLYGMHGTRLAMVRLLAQSILSHECSVWPSV